MVNRITISATAPPTIANLAVGFDMLGLAVDGHGDVVHIKASEVSGIQLEIEGDNEQLSIDPLENTATAGIVGMLSDLGKEDMGLQIKLEKKMPLGSGMGSSASSAAAGVFAANAFFGYPFSKTELIKYALIGESVASGAVHGDNVVPSLLGGLVLMRSNEPADAIALSFINKLTIVLIHPHVEVMTSQSRARLAAQVSMSNHVKQSADSAAFIHAMHTGDVDLLRRCMNDHIIAPQRIEDIPLFGEVREIMAKHTSINYDISGSGPSSFAFFELKEQAEKSMREIQELMQSRGMGCDIEITQIDLVGAKLV